MALLRLVYCLMSNHYHLLIETQEPNPGRGMRRLNGAYTQIFNRGHRRVGHLLQGRYKSILVDREAYLLELCRYVALNPVRASLVDDPAQWPWSSFAANAGLTPSPGWLTAEVEQDGDGPMLPQLVEFGRGRTWDHWPWSQCKVKN